MKLIRSKLDLNSRVLVMGILNVTPDSFSDGGQFNDPQRAVERALEIEAEGADILDIGGESTRPGSQPITVDEERTRVLPVLERLQGRLRIPISIDTTHSEIARMAIECGAEMINDISGLRFDPKIGETAAETGAGLVLMHSRGTPARMHQLPPVDDIFVEVCNGLYWAIDQAEQRGVKREKIILDPGIGFGKTTEQNLQLVMRLDRIVAEFNLPVMLGPSRKSFIKRIFAQRMNTSVDNGVRERMGGTAASIAIGVLRGARIVRVHDVSEMVAVVRLTEAMMAAQ